MIEAGVEEIVEAEVRPAARSPVGFAMVLMVLTLILGLSVTFKIGEPSERAIMKALALREQVTSDALIAAARWATWTGDAAQRTLEMVLFAGWLFWRKRPRAALVMLIVPPLAGATSSILKEIFSRARPDIVPHLDAITNLSFPSGHATNAMATLLLAALLIAQTRRGLWIAAAIAAAAMIGASRILLGVHWPSDVVGGWLWGAGIALIGLTVAQRLEAHQNAKRSPILMSRPPSGA